MKKLSKILALLLAFLILTMSFTACKVSEKSSDEDSSQGEEKESKRNERDDEEEIEEIADSFLNAYISVDFDESLEYAISDAEDKTKEREESLSQLYESYNSKYDLSNKQMEQIINTALDSASYKIKDIEIDENTAEVKATIKVPDFNELDSFNQSEDFTNVIIYEVLADKLGYDNYRDAKEADQYGLISTEDVTRYLSDIAFAGLSACAQDISIISKEITLSLEYDDDEWLITEYKTK